MHLVESVYSPSQRIPCPNMKGNYFLLYHSHVDYKPRQHEYDHVSNLTLEVWVILFQVVYTLHFLHVCTFLKMILQIHQWATSWENLFQNLWSAVAQIRLDSYDKLPIHSNASFHGSRTAIFQLIFCGIFPFFLAPNKDCQCSLELPWWDGSSKYPQSVFELK